MKKNKKLNNSSKNVQVLFFKEWLKNINIPMKVALWYNFKQFQYVPHFCDHITEIFSVWLKQMSLLLFENLYYWVGSKIISVLVKYDFVMNNLTII